MSIRLLKNRGLTCNAFGVKGGKNV